LESVRESGVYEKYRCIQYKRIILKTNSMGKALHEKQTGPQPVKEFPSFGETR
jgi:hypothetical protein